ncbi:hypothetical protein ABID42_002150 [Arcicella rosea]|uniref:hypothetical protein n=1 Tax=Arcicella rosea TaxID=502909 RepID=UPI00345DBAD4
MKTHTFKLSTIIATLLVILSGCSKERFDAIKKDEVIPPPVVKVEVFPAVDEQAKKTSIVPVETTKKKVNSAGDFSFTTKKGTTIKANKYDFMLPNGDWVDYPVDIEIQELYTPADMILNRVSTVSNGKMLITGGQVNISVSKDGKPLVLNPYNNTFSINIPTPGYADPTMKVFYGNEQSNGTVDWQPAVMQQEQQQPADTTKKDSIVTKMYFEEGHYKIFPTQIGWINVDKFMNSPVEKTVLKFTSKTPAIGSIFIFLYFDKIKSVMEVYNGSAKEIPVGEHIKLVCYAVSEDENLFSFFKDFNVAVDQSIEIQLEKTTKEEFLKYLQGL